MLISITLRIVVYDRTTSLFRVCHMESKVHPLHCIQFCTIFRHLRQGTLQLIRLVIHTQLILRQVLSQVLYTQYNISLIHLLTIQLQSHNHILVISSLQILGTDLELTHTNRIDLISISRTVTASILHRVHLTISETLQIRQCLSFSLSEHRHCTISKDISIYVSSSNNCIDTITLTI